MNIKVSVIIPTYKRDTALERAIRSILNQSYSNTEIIVIDDNGPSTEYRNKVEKIISKMHSYSNNLVYLKNDVNMGSANTRNIGIAAATGEYITFLDDDDIYEHDKIKKQLNYMLKNGLDMSFTDLVLKNQNEKIVDLRIRDGLKDFENNTLLKYHLMHHITGTNTFMYKSNLLKNIGGFDPIDIGDEFYLMIKTIKSSAKIGYLSGCDIVSYVHNNKGGLSTGNKKIEGENILYSFKKGYFDILLPKEKRYIKFRHYSVIAFAYLKRKKYISVIKNGVIAVVISPFSAVKGFATAMKILAISSRRIR